MNEDKTKSGLVSIIGRSNVGKSTLLNHLIEHRFQLPLENLKQLDSECWGLRLKVYVKQLLSILQAIIGAKKEL